MKPIYCIAFLVVSFHVLYAQPIPQQLDDYLSHSKKFGKFNGTALVMYKGQVLLYKGYGYKNVNRHTMNDTVTIYRIGSLSKPFTATIILYLEQKGLLQLRDAISKYMPGYPHGDSITIEHLLTHSSGVKEYLGVRAIQQLPDDAPPVSMERLIAYFKDESMAIQPGEKFAYSNSNYILLACIIEKVTGEKYEHVVRKIIFDPLAMQHSGFDFKHLHSADKATGHTDLEKKVDTIIDFDSTYAPGCGSMYTTAMDLYRWYRGLYSGRVIGDTARERAFIPRRWKYGYGWLSYSLYGKKCISHAGGVPGFFSNLQFYPDDDLCIVVLSNSWNGDPDGIAGKLASIVFQKRYQSSGL